MSSLVYIADPMCSWCYGFGPELNSLLAGLPGLPIEVVVGGLRTDNGSVMDHAFKTKLLGHWREVHAKSGLPFAEEALDRPGLVYNTEAACRAVVAARTLGPGAGLAVFHAIQRAFYAEGQDVTQGNVLATIAAPALTHAGVPIERSAFFTLWDSPEIRAATQRDFALVKQWGVSGFPTLVLERDGKLDLVASGYVKMPRLVELMETLISDPNPDANPDAKTDANSTA